MVSCILLKGAGTWIRRSGFKSRACQSYPWYEGNPSFNAASLDDYCFLYVRYQQEYFDRIDEVGIPLGLTRATVSHVQMTGMGDRVCVDICSLMKPGEGLLVCFLCPSGICDLLQLLIDHPIYFRCINLIICDSIFAGWILCKRTVPSALGVLRNKLHFE